MDINLYHPGNTFKSRNLHSLPDLNNNRLAGYTNAEIRNIIERDVCEYFDIPMYTLLKKSRKQERVTARYMIMYLLIHYTSYSLQEISEFYNMADHTAALHAKQAVSNILLQKTSTPEKQLLNAFLCKYGYKAVEKPVPQQQKAFVIDAHY